MKFKLDHDFIRSTALVLDVEDLRVGLSLGMISAPTAIGIAADAVTRGATSATLRKESQMDLDDVSSVREALHATDPDQTELRPPQSVRKWTYLELKTAYDMRSRLRDPLGIVEEIYADFGYPVPVAAFVRYMPPPPGAPVGEDALYDRWSRYLAGEAASLTHVEEQP